MRILLVLAHPLEDSFIASVAATVKRKLTSNGHTVDLIDLHREGFEGPVGTNHTPQPAEPFVSRLKQADGLVLVFPQWWYNFPAILKRFFDRVFVPGVAFEKDPAGRRIEPGLGNIHLIWAFTTDGAPRRLVDLYMGNPVKRLLKRGIGAVCAKGLDFRMVSLYDMDRANEIRRKRHLNRVKRLVDRI